jgi:glycosyltransferase involved in cell wall biosynthesis
MRVLHIVGTMDLGGLENFIMNLYRNINRKQVQFDFVVHNQEENYHEKEIHELGGIVHRVSSKKKSMIKNLTEMYNLFVNNKYDVIHIHTNSATCLTDIIIAKLCKIKHIIVHSHSTNTRKNKTLIHKIFKSTMNRLTDYKFACSDKAAEWLFGERITDVNIINNAIDINRYLYNQKIANQYRKTYGIKDNTLFVGHIGNFSVAKNHMLLIDIFQSVLERNINSKLILVGQGPLQKEVIDKVEKLGLSEHVIFAGLREDIPEILSAIDVLLFPSLYEGFPVTLVEAQSAGLKCIISDTITKQVILTELIEQVSLTDSPVKWAEKLLSTTPRYNRSNTYQEIVKKGFNIKEEALKLQDFYLSL